MNITVIGTGYVGLVTGVCLSEIGHQVMCIDLDKHKIEKLKLGISPIYESGLEDLITKNIMAGRLSFTSEYSEGMINAEVVYIAVGTPQNKDGTANLTFIENAAKCIAQNIQNSVIVVTKSTVPVGTNNHIKNIIESYLESKASIEVVSNPEFLREGSAIQDTFHGDRIVIGSNSVEAADTIEEIYKPLGIPVFKTDIQSAELIKYASNAFLATKISFINEISNLCEKLGANVEDVASGMGLDKRIGSQFLNAGIGYGGSCFPKDTNALVQIGGGINHNFSLLKSVIEVNNNQQALLVEKAKKRFRTLEGKKVAVLGLTFKPNTDDMRESAAIPISNELIRNGAEIIAFDPIAIHNAKAFLPEQVQYADSIEEALKGADMAFILTEWDHFKYLNLNRVKVLMKEPIIFDGRNCFSLNTAKQNEIEYHSIGRPIVNNKYKHIREESLTKEIVVTTRLK